ncbi:membrane hypothetical protein [Nocardioides sp. AX2bis]|nr:membrane hypothetical protein [Nocardioides sp. AX2bis]
MTPPAPTTRPTEVPAARRAAPVVPAEPSAPSEDSSGPWWAGAATAVRRPARPTTDDRPAVDPAVEHAAPVAPREPWTPPLTGLRAVAVVGLVAGLLIVGLTTGALALCETVRGTPSCGGAGYLFLTAIVVGVALLGGLALAALQVSDPRGTSVLAVGVVAVIVLLLLVPVIFSWTMVLVIPALSVAAFLGSHWLTTVSGDETPAWERPTHDDALR